MTSEPVMAGTVAVTGGGRTRVAGAAPTPRNTPRNAIVSIPGPVPGQVRFIDGERLLAAATGFARALHAAGLAIDLGAVIDFARALGLLDLGDRAAVRAAGAAIFVRRREDLDLYGRIFDRFWRARRSAGPAMPPSVAISEDPPPEPREERERGPATPERQVDAAGIAGGGRLRELDAPPDDGVEALVISPHAYSHDSVDRHLQFDRMTRAELADAERCIDLLAPRVDLRRTRRRELYRSGKILAPRPMFRRNLKTGGDAVEWVWQRPVRRPRAIVVLCDISGSMERHARLLLRFTQALATSSVRTEAFVFGTRLTRVTRLLDDGDRDRALARAAAAVTDWSGGTRIGECFREFNRHWARRVLRSSAVVVVVSDGWDRGDPALVADETARLRRSCHRLIWLNPLASAPGYQPLAAGMAAALPHVDAFVPAGTLGSLESLAVLLGDVASRRSTAGAPRR